MSAEDGNLAPDVDLMLSAAQKVVTGVRYCWLVSRNDERVRARPMGRLPPSEGDEDWTFGFLTDCRSSKISDLRNTSSVGLIFQNEGDDAFASLAGPARLIADVSEVPALWKRGAYARRFPTKTDQANAGFIEVRVNRMELWIRGVTPEPFGLHTTVLQRDQKGTWFLAR